MRQEARVALLALLMALASVSCIAQDKVTLVLRAKAGQAAHYKSEGTLKMDAGGMKIDLELKETEKVTVTEVAVSFIVRVTLAGAAPVYQDWK